jgi:hypothetical protein
LDKSATLQTLCRCTWKEISLQQVYMELTTSADITDRVVYAIIAV